MRLTAIDGFRGIFLVFMMIVHANDVLKTTFGKLNHHYFGWVEDAQGFVFMSGLVVGLVYGKRFLRLGFDAMSGAIWGRIKTIYSHQIGLIVLLLIATLACSMIADVPSVLRPYDTHPVAFPALSALMVTGSMHMGILPMYIFFMMATPYALRLLHQRRYLTYTAIVATLWLIAQTRLPDALVSGAEGLAGIKLGIFFNVLGWQVLFFGGLFAGFLMAAERLNLEFLETPEMRRVFLLCVALFFLLGIYDRIVFDDWFGAAFSEAILSEADRGNFSTIYLFAFAVDLLAIVWLLGPGRQDRSPLISGTARAIGKAVTFRPLVFLGQHSLHVFSAHIVIVYALAIAFEDAPPSEAVGASLIVLSIALLYLVAWGHARATSRRKTPAQAPAAAE